VVANHESLAFVADQNAGDRGLFVPFFGRLASTYKAIAVTAHAYNLPVVVGWAKRVGGSDLAGDANCGQTLPSALRFDMHIADVFTPKDWADAPDPIFYITARYRRALESAFVEAPDQVLWMHRFWKSRPRHEREKKPFPAVLARKLRELPWLDDAKVEAIIERSNRDAAEYTPKKRRGSVESSTAGDLSADA
jgi:KDO2-lipid IV(A) lauroyltransferase